MRTQVPRPIGGMNPAQLKNGMTLVCGGNGELYSLPCQLFDYAIHNRPAGAQNEANCRYIASYIDIVLCQRTSRRYTLSSLQHLNTLLLCTDIRTPGINNSIIGTVSIHINITCRIELEHDDFYMLPSTCACACMHAHIYIATRKHS